MATDLKIQLKLYFAFARKRGLPPFIADDFSQYAAMKRLKSPNRDLLWIFRDFLRKEKGDSRRKKHRARLQTEYITQTDLENLPAKNRTDDRLIITEFLDNLPPYPRLLFVLYKAYEFQLDEIAFMCGLSQSRLSQIMSEIEDEYIEKR